MRSPYANLAYRHTRDAWPSSDLLHSWRKPVDPENVVILIVRHGSLFLM